jgi:DNA-binding XRE family transcriptional regulator
MKKTKLTTFDEYKKRALKDSAFRKALGEPDDDPFLEVAYRLIALRHELGLTQVQLARKINVSQQALARLESLSYKGHSLRSLNKIAQACGKKLQINFVKA